MTAYYTEGAYHNKKRWPKLYWEYLVESGYLMKFSVTGGGGGAAHLQINDRGKSITVDKTTKYNTVSSDV